MDEHEVLKTLGSKDRMIIARRGDPTPVAVAVDYWWDGDGVWFFHPAKSETARALWSDGNCAAYVPSDDPTQPGVLVRGGARVFGLHDLVGLALHAPMIGLASTGLAVRHSNAVAGHIKDLIDEPARLDVSDRVLIRVIVNTAEPVAAPMVDDGIAPALPTGIPAEVRRRLGGTRRVVLAMAVDRGLGVVPAVWGSGYSLTLPQGMIATDQAPATVVLDRDPGGRPSEVAGVAMSGRINASGAAPKLVASQAVWWDGVSRHDVPITTPSETIIIPD